MKKSNNTTIIYVKKSQTNISEPNQQTLKLRENANSKIKIFGNHFYEIKNIFDRINLRRDSLYYAGKEIEKRFSNIKKITPLQNQYKRLKDSLLVWFTENFYSELINQNQLVYEIIRSVQSVEYFTKVNQRMDHINIKKNKKNSDEKIEKHDTIVLNKNLMANTEIDEYNTLQTEENTNFDFNKYLLF